MTATAPPPPPPPGPGPGGGQLPPLVRLGEATLVSVAQVDLQGNIWTGVMILAGIFAKGWTTGVFALLGTVSAIVCARLLGADQESITEGLQGFSGCLTGIALVLTLGNHPWTWVLTVFAGAACCLVTAALATLLGGWGITGLTAPFCLVSGAVLLAAPAFTRLTHQGPAAALPTAAQGPTGLSWHDLWHGFFTNIAEVFLLDTWYSGVLMLAGLFLAGLRVGLFTVAASLVAILTAWALGAPASLVSGGIYGYNAVLVGIALGVTFLRPGPAEALYALFGCVVSCVLTAASNGWVAPFGGHTFTWPFIVTTWLLLLAVPAFKQIRRR